MADFPEYATKYSPDARESRRLIPPEQLIKLEEIESQMADDPINFSRLSIPASVSVDRKAYIYIHDDPRFQITYEIDEQKKILYFFHFASPVFKVRDTLFISYSHVDKEWLEKIRKFLAVLEQQGSIKFWDDNKIQAGEIWKDKINAALDAATASVLLVSQDFLTSKFITETELPKLLDAAQIKGKKIFWIHIRPSTVFDSHKEITKYQSLLANPSVALARRTEVEQEQELVSMTKSLLNAINVH